MYERNHLIWVAHHIYHILKPAIAFHTEILQFVNVLKHVPQLVLPKKNSDIHL